MSRHTKTLTRSFAGGEMSPEMFGRMDDAKFQAGAATLLNMIPRPTGSAARRPGTQLVREIRDSTKTAKLFPFVFSPTQSYAIEASRATVDSLEGGYFRFHSNGGTLLYSAPDRWIGKQRVHPYPAHPVSCTSAAPMVVTLADHGLSSGDVVKFVGGTPPGGFSLLTTYYVILVSSSQFQLAATSGGGGITSTTTGFEPVLHCWPRFKGASNFKSDSHGFKTGDPVVLTMWPEDAGPQVDFTKTTFQVSSGNPSLAKSGFGQQVLFSPDAGATLPSGIEEGRVYWTKSYEVFPDVGWTISESFGGPQHTIGTGSSGIIRIASMPPRTGGEGSYIGCNEVYYVVRQSANLIKLAYSKSEAEKGESFTFDLNGTGERHIHRVYEPGENVSYVDGGVRNYVCRKSTWRSPVDSESVLVTEKTHDQDGARVPGDRASLFEGDYWRELPGRSTGSLFPVVATTDGGHLLLTATDQNIQTNQAVSFVRGQIPTLTAGSVALDDPVYFARDVSANTFKIALTAGGAAIAGIDAAGTQPGNLAMQACVTFDTSTHKIGWVAHGLSNGDTVVFSQSVERPSGSVMQSPLVFDTTYYVREKDTNDFRVSATASGPLIDLTATTAGVRVTASGDTIYEVPHDYSADEIDKMSTTQSNDIMTFASGDHPVSELRRLATTKWELADVKFQAGASVPGTLYESSIVPGEQVRITELATDGSFGSYFVVGDNSHFRHSFSLGDPVYVSGLGDNPAYAPTGDGPLADGFYVIAHPTQDANQRAARKIFLSKSDTNDRVTHGGDQSTLTVSSTYPNARIRYGSLGEDITQTYVVTAIDSNNEESLPTDSLTVTNNLLVSGASNTIGWGASSSAVRYRVYKQLSGLYGLIGETDELTFKDDNIGPDLAVSPPIDDPALRKESRVTFNATSDVVTWTGHGLPAKTPVVFYGSDQMPSVENGKTYYVINPSENGFQITADIDSDSALDIVGTDTGLHLAVAGNFPSATTYFEGRRIFGGSKNLPQDIWMTASGTEADMSYSVPTVDSDRIYFRIASREGSAVRHLLPLSQLVLLSDSTEYRLTPANDDVLTPSSISVRPQSFVGAGYSRPSLVNNTVVFSAARGGHVRELGYNADVLGYLTGDLSVRAAHLFDGYTIKDQTYSKAPLPLVWCVSSSGKLLGLTYIPEEQVGAWHQHTTTDGTFESVASVPEGDEDAVYVIVNRTVASGTKRYVERLSDVYRGGTSNISNANFVDFGMTYSGASTTTVSGLDHLEGKTVSYLADGVAGTGTVTSGTLTLAKAASTVQVGLGYTSRIQTLPMTMMNVDAFGTGRTKNVNKVWVRIFESGAFKAGPSASNLRASLSPSSGSLATDLVQVALPASWDDDGQIVIQQEDPLPLTVVGLTIEVASGG